MEHKGDKYLQLAQFTQPVNFDLPSSNPYLSTFICFLHLHFTAGACLVAPKMP